MLPGRRAATLLERRSRTRGDRSRWGGPAKRGGPRRRGPSPRPTTLALLSDWVARRSFDSPGLLAVLTPGPTPALRVPPRGSGPVRRGEVACEALRGVIRLLPTTNGSRASPGDRNLSGGRTVRLTDGERTGILRSVARAADEVGASWRRVSLFGSRTDLMRRGGDSAPSIKSSSSMRARRPIAYSAWKSGASCLRPSGGGSYVCCPPPSCTTISSRAPRSCYRRSSPNSLACARSASMTSWM